jgi:hypothetical protein
MKRVQPTSRGGILGFLLRGVPRNLGTSFVCFGGTGLGTQDFDLAKQCILLW